MKISLSSVEKQKWQWGTPDTIKKYLFVEGERDEGGNWFHIHKKMVDCAAGKKKIIVETFRVD